MQHETRIKWAGPQNNHLFRHESIQSNNQKLGCQKDVYSAGVIFSFSGSQSEMAQLSSRCLRVPFSCCVSESQSIHHFVDDECLLVCPPYLYLTLPLIQHATLTLSRARKQDVLSQFRLSCVFLCFS